MNPAQRLDRDTAVVEDAETGGGIAPGVVQSGDGYEGPPRLAAYQVGDGCQHGANDPGGGLVHADEGRGVALIEIAGPGHGGSPYAIDVGRAMKSLDLRPLRHGRFHQVTAPVQTGLAKPGHECIEPGRAERVVGAEVVGPELFAGVDTDVLHDQGAYTTFAG